MFAGSLIKEMSKPYIKIKLKAKQKTIETSLVNQPLRRK